MNNYWHLSGEVVRIKELFGIDIGASVLIRTAAQRESEADLRLAEILVLFPKKIYSESEISPYSVVDLTGHFETKVIASDLNLKYKTSFIVDTCELLKK